MSLSFKLYLCSEIHFYFFYSYIIKQNRSVKQILNTEIQKAVDNKIAQNKRIRRIIKIERKRAHFKNKKNQNFALKSQEEKKRSDIKISTKITAFTVDQNSYEL